MRARSRSAVVALLVIMATSLSVAAGAAATVTPAPMTLEAAEILKERDATDRWAAFVIMEGLDRRERATVLRSYGLDAVENFDAIDTTYAAGLIASFRRLVDDPAVSYIEHNREYRLFGDSSGWASRVESVRRPAAGGPYRSSDGAVIDGTGVGIAIVDGGIWGQHPDLASRIEKNFKVTCKTPGLARTSTGECYGGVEYVEAEDSDSSSGHGTHVAGIAAGDGTASNGFYRGVAPGAKLYGFSVGEGIAIDSLQAIGAFRWILDNGASQNPPIRVINNSWGCVGGCPFDPNSTVNKFATRLVESGMVITWSAGNSGENNHDGATNTMAGSSMNPTLGVIAVANYDDANRGDRNNTLDLTSSRGKAADADKPERFPDVSAPGSDIAAPCKRGMTACELPFGIPDTRYAPLYSRLWGTSMAAPHTAGIAALMLQARPDLTPAQVELALENSAHQYTGGTGAPGSYVPDPTNPTTPTSFDKGHGLVDAVAALTALGVDADGNGSVSDPEMHIDTPVEGELLRGDVAVGGSAADGWGTAPTSWTLEADDSGDYDGPGAADIVSVQAEQVGSSAVYSFVVRDLADRPSDGAAVGFRIMANLDGRQAWSHINVQPDGSVTVPAAGTSNHAVASGGAADLTTNTVTMTVPFSAYGAVNPDSVLHNIQMATYVGVIQDFAPGRVGAEINTAPEPTPAITFQPQQGSAPVPTVDLRIGDVLVGTGTISGTSPSFTWSGTIDSTLVPDGSEVLTAELRLDGAVRATDSIDVEVDNIVTPPVVTSPAAGALLNDNLATIAGTSEPDASISVSEGGVEIVTAVADGAGAWSTTHTFADGPHTIAVTASKGGLVSTATERAFTVVTKPTIMTPAENATVSTLWVSFTGTARPGSTVTVREAGSPVATTTTLSDGRWAAGANMTAGVHIVNATASTGNGGESPPSADRTFTVVPDTMPPAKPEITSPTNGALLGSSVRPEGTAEPKSTVRIYDGTRLAGSTIATTTGTWSVGLVLPSGERTLTAKAVDAAGNVSEASDPVVVTIDGVKPTVTFVTPEGHVFGPGDAFEIRGTASDGSGVDSVLIEFYDALNRKAATVEATLSAPGGTETEWTAAPEGLSPGRYRIRAFATDALGNVTGPLSRLVYKVG